MDYVLTEQQIENIVEKTMDALDKKLMSHKLTQSEYEQEIHILDKWAIQQYKHLQEQTA